MPRNATPISEQLRKAIRDSGETLLGIAGGAKLDDGQLSRFMRGQRDLTTRSLDRLCAYLHLELRSSKRKGR